MAKRRKGRRVVSEEERLRRKLERARLRWLEKPVDREMVLAGARRIYDAFTSDVNVPWLRERRW